MEEQTLQTSIKPEPSLGKLAEALSKAQGEIKPPKKNKKAHYGMYADLTACNEAAYKSLSKFGLSVSHLPCHGNAGFVLKTILMHSSGEKIECQLPIGNYKGFHDLGGALTYLKRYSFCAIIGLSADDDDDGQTANKNVENRSSAASKPKPNTNPAKPGKLSDKQIKRMLAIGNKSKVKSDEIKDACEVLFDKNPRDLNKKEYDEICTMLELAREEFIDKIVAIEKIKTEEMA